MPIKGNKQDCTKKWDKNQDDYLIELYNDYYSLSDIANITNRSWRSIQHRLRRLGLKRDYKKVHKKHNICDKYKTHRREILIKYCKLRLPIKLIANEFNCTNYVIETILGKRVLKSIRDEKKRLLKRNLNRCIKCLNIYKYDFFPFYSKKSRGNICKICLNEQKSKYRKYKYNNNIEYRKYYQEKVKNWIKEKRNHPEYRERFRNYNKKWKENNQEKYQEYKRTQNINGKAKKMGAQGKHTPTEWRELKEKFNNSCLCCNCHQDNLDSPLERDHVIALSKGGTNYVSNLQVLCSDCNNNKGTDIIDYRPESLREYNNIDKNIILEEIKRVEKYLESLKRMI